MWLGVDYYPEQWPEERWPVDAKLMKEAGLTIVRLAEFAWSHIEPEEGRFDFSWLDRAIDILRGHDIRVVLGTPTAAPPAWLIKRHPEVLPHDYTRTPKSFGIRRHYCFNSEAYHDHAKAIAGEMARHYCANPAIVGWQIDNEFGCHDTTRCYCENCARAFRRWLRAKYGSVTDLNAAWGTAFWSQEFTEWDQIPLPWKSVEAQAAYNPSLLLDYYRFASDSVVAFQEMQVDVLRDLCPRHFITHNLMGTFDQIDYFDLAADLDFVSWDNYPNYWDSSPHPTGMSHDLMWGVRACNFWVMEQQSGAIGWNTFGRSPPPGVIRMWTYQAIGHGAETVVYFRWRTARAGTEQFWHGILDHHGSPGRRYDEVARTGAELHKHAHEWSRGCHVNQVAIMVSYPIAWSLQIQPQNTGLSYWREVHRMYEALRKLGIGVDLIPTGGNLSGYKLVIAPLLVLVDVPLARRLEDYVTGGGRLVCTFRTGLKDENNIVTDQPLPGRLAGLLGIRVAEYDSLPPSAAMAVKVLASGAEVKGRIWADIIEPDSAEVLAVYTEAPWAGRAAATANRAGNGTAWYIGTALDQDFYADLFRRIAGQAGIRRLAWVPEGVDASTRWVNGKQVIFLVNPYGHAQRLDLDRQYHSILDGKAVSGRVDLPGYGVMVLKTEEKAEKPGR